MEGIDKLAQFLGKKIFISLVLIILLVYYFKQDSSHSSIHIVEQNAPTNYRTATIKDSDGYTNIRPTPSLDKNPIGRIKDGEIFWFKANSSNWWEIKTKNGIKGYMAKSRINPF